MKKTIQAFTLIELMIALAIAGIVSAYGVPFLGRLMTNNALTNTNNDLVASLQYARSSSIRLQGRVIVCTSNNTTAAVPTCGGPGVPWTAGWLIFQNNDASVGFDSGDTLLRTYPRVTADSLTINTVALGGTPTNIADFVMFDAPAGEPILADLTNQSGIFRICVENDTTHIRGVMVNVSGRIASTRDTSIIGSSCP